jgi:hypothetical protein
MSRLVKRLLTHLNQSKLTTFWSLIIDRVTSVPHIIVVTLTHANKLALMFLSYNYQLFVYHVVDASKLLDIFHVLEESVRNC